MRYQWLHMPLSFGVGGLLVASVIAIGESIGYDASAAGTRVTPPPTATTTTLTATPSSPDLTPATPPSIGAEGAWDPEADPPLIGGDEFAGDTVTASVATTAEQPVEPQPTTVPSPSAAQPATGPYSWTWTYRSRSTRSTASTTTATPTTDAPPPDPTEEPTMPTDPLTEIIDDVLTP